MSKQPKLPQLSKDEQAQIVRQEFERLLAETFLPTLQDLFDVEKQAALRNDPTGRQAREAIYNRLVGRPVEQSERAPSQTIVVNITRYDPDEIERRGSMVKGMERSTPSASSSPTPIPPVLDHDPEGDRSNETPRTSLPEVPIPKGTVRLFGPKTELSPVQPRSQVHEIGSLAELVSADQDQQPLDGLTSFRREKAIRSLPPKD